MNATDAPDATPAGPRPAAPVLGERRVRRLRLGKTCQTASTLWYVEEWRGSAWEQVGDAHARADAELLAFAGPRLAALEAALKECESLMDEAAQMTPCKPGCGCCETVIRERTECLANIRAALALGAAGEGSNGWVAFADRKPGEQHERRFILVAGRNSDEHRTWYRCTAVYFPDGEVRDSHSNRLTPSHWMPLAEPPTM